MFRKITAFAISFGLLFQQIGFAQVAVELNIANYLSRIGSSLTQEKFRPPQLRYFSYDALSDNFKVLLDKGDLKNLQTNEIEDSTKVLLNYFLVGVSLPDSMFWVNLRPDSEDQIIDPYLEKTDVGKVMLEADLQLKKDTAAFTSPQTPEGREYWNKLYKKAEELYGYEAVDIPTLTRPWIVPGEIIIRESQDSAYVYKAGLKVMLEQDYLSYPQGRGRLNVPYASYEFKDPRSKALNEYSSQLIRELIIPKLTKEVNSAKRYAALRQVYYSLILSRWFKLRFTGQAGGTYSSLINTADLTNLTSREPWSKTDYFQQYRKSFQDGEYNIKEPVYTPTGQVIRSYFSGGLALQDVRSDNGFNIANSPILIGNNQNNVLFKGKGDLPGRMTRVERTGRGAFNDRADYQALERPASPVSLKETVEFLNQLSTKWLLRFQIGDETILQHRYTTELSEGVGYYGPVTHNEALSYAIVVRDNVEPKLLLQATLDFIKNNTFIWDNEAQQKDKGEVTEKITSRLNEDSANSSLHNESVASPLREVKASTSEQSIVLAQINTSKIYERSESDFGGPHISLSSDVTEGRKRIAFYKVYSNLEHRLAWIGWIDEFLHYGGMADSFRLLPNAHRAFEITDGNDKMLEFRIAAYAGEQGEKLFYSMPASYFQENRDTVIEIREEPAAASPMTLEDLQRQLDELSQNAYYAFVNLSQQKEEAISRLKQTASANVKGPDDAESAGKTYDIMLKEITQEFAEKEKRLSEELEEDRQAIKKKIELLQNDGAGSPIDNVKFAIMQILALEKKEDGLRGKDFKAALEILKAVCENYDLTDFSTALEDAIAHYGPEDGVAIPRIKAELQVLLAEMSRGWLKWNDDLKMNVATVKPMYKKEELELLAESLTHLIQSYSSVIEFSNIIHKIDKLITEYDANAHGEGSILSQLVNDASNIAGDLIVAGSELGVPLGREAYHGLLAAQRLNFSGNDSAHLQEWEKHVAAIKELLGKAKEELEEKINLSQDSGASSAITNGVEITGLDPISYSQEGIAKLKAAIAEHVVPLIVEDMKKPVAPGSESSFTYDLSRYTRREFRLSMPLPVNNSIPQGKLLKGTLYLNNVYFAGVTINISAASPLHVTGIQRLSSGSIVVKLSDGTVIQGYGAKEFADDWNSKVEEKSGIHAITRDVAYPASYIEFFYGGDYIGNTSTSFSEVVIKEDLERALSIASQKKRGGASSAVQTEEIRSFSNFVDTIPWDGNIIEDKTGQIRITQQRFIEVAAESKASLPEIREFIENYQKHFSMAQLYSLIYFSRNLPLSTIKSILTRDSLENQNKSAEGVKTSLDDFERIEGLIRQEIRKASTAVQNNSANETASSSSLTNVERMLINGLTLTIKLMMDEGFTGVVVTDKASLGDKVESSIYHFGSNSYKLDIIRGTKAKPETLIASILAVSELPEEVKNMFRVRIEKIAPRLLQSASSAVGGSKDIDASLRSPSMPETGKTGGIDFRALPMTIKPMGSFQGLDFTLPKLTQTELEQIDVDKELRQIENLVQSGITPSGARLKELIAACAQKEGINSYADHLLICLVDICKLEEENASESSPELKEALVIVDAAS